MPSGKAGKTQTAMKRFRCFSLSVLPGAILLLASFAFAIEVSDVTVDFPLSEVLKLQDQEEGGAAGDGSAIVVGKSRFPRSPWEEDWFSYRQGILRGNFRAASESLERVIAYRKDHGIPNLYLPSIALLKEASLARKENRFEDSLDIISIAGDLAPETPGPHFQKARTIWSQNQLRALSALDAILEGTGAFLKDFRSLFPWVLDFALWLLLGLAVGSSLTIFLLFFRVVPRLSHDLSHLVKVPHWVLILSFLVLLGAVLVSGMSLVLWVILLALLMVLHLSSRERLAVMIALVLMASVPAFLHVLSLGRDYFSDSRSLAIYKAERGGEGSQTLDELHYYRVRDAEDSEVLAAMSLVLKRSGNMKEAESLLRRAMEITPFSPRYLNNLGNILLGTGRIEQAIAHYRDALRYKDDPRIHYNLSQALRENLQLEEGETEFRIAQERSPALTEMLMESQQATVQRITMDIFRGMGATLVDSLSLTTQGHDYRNRLWAGIVPKIPFRGSWLLFLGACAVVYLGGLAGRNFRGAARCRKCGHLHCHRCSQSARDGLCAQCRQIFIVRSGVDPAGRVRKMMQILSFNKRKALISRFATVLFPGLGHSYLGAGWQSLVFITLSVFFWSKWVFWHGFFRSTTSLQIEAGFSSRIVFGLFLVAYYLFALKKIGDRLEEK